MEIISRPLVKRTEQSVISRVFAIVDEKDSLYLEPDTCQTLDALEVEDVITNEPGDLAKAIRSAIYTTLVVTGPLIVGGIHIDINAYTPDFKTIVEFTITGVTPETFDRLMKNLPADIAKTFSTKQGK